MAESDLIRGNVDTIILKILYEGDRYGYDLIKQINARGDGQWEIKQPTVYACLKRLEKQGFISSYWDSSESDGGRRKYYSLTESGREVFLKYKSEYERASALFGGIISGSDVPPIPVEDDFSDVEEEGYSVPKRKSKRKPKQDKPQQTESPEQPQKTDIPEQPQPPEQPQNGENVIPQDIFTLLEQQQRMQQQQADKERAERQEREQREQQERDEQALLEQQRLEEERREQELLEQARRERAEREKELLEQAQREQEQLDQELLELRLSEQEQRQRELEQQLEQQRLEHERLEQELLEHRLEEQLQQQETQNEEPPEQSQSPERAEPPLREPLDPKQIIESYYAAESGESFSDAQRKNNLTETPAPARAPLSPKPIEKEQAPPTPPAPTAPAVPATRPTVEPAPAQSAPPPSPVGFDDEESPARREYKSVLEELVDRFEVTPPDLHDRGAATAEQAATTERAETPQADSRQLSKVEQSVRELGNSLTVRSHNNSAKEYSGKHYYYCNRLMMTHYTIMCAIMFVLGLTLFLTFYSGLNMRMRYDYILYIGAGLLPVAMFIAAVIRYATDADKKKRINVNFRFSVIIRTVIMLQVCVIIYCLNLIWGMPVGFSAGFIPSLVLPAVYALFIPVSELIFMHLLKSGNYAVEQ